MWPVFFLWIFEHWGPLGFPLPDKVVVLILRLIVTNCEFRLKKQGGVCFRYRVPSLLAFSKNSLINACHSGKEFHLFHMTLLQHKREEERLGEIELEYKKLFCQIPKVYREALKRAKEKAIADGDKPRSYTPTYISSFVEMYKGVWEDEIPTEAEKNKCLEIIEEMVSLREKGELLKSELEHAWISRFLLFDEHVIPHVHTHKKWLTEKMQFYLSLPSDFRDLLEETGDKRFIERIFRSLTGLSERKSSRLVRYALENSRPLSEHVEEVLKFLKQPYKGNQHADWMRFWC